MDTLATDGPPEGLGDTQPEGRGFLPTYPTPTDLERALLNLPETPEGIARYLQVSGMAGRQHSSCECPIARYCRWYYGSEVIVGTDAATLHYDGRHTHIPLPVNVQTFIERFDKGEFPHLSTGKST